MQHEYIAGRAPTGLGSYVGPATPCPGCRHAAPQKAKPTDIEAMPTSQLIIEIVQLEVDGILALRGVQPQQVSTATGFTRMGALCVELNRRIGCGNG